MTANWRGRPLVSLRTIIELFSSATTATGLVIESAHDPISYPTGVHVTDAELAAVALSPHDWHGDWNYTINARSDVA
ncbi:MAG: ISAzo13-like element transposase-related protein [Acidimicrobiales bacterium]